MVSFALRVYVKSIWRCSIKEGADRHQRRFRLEEDASVASRSRLAGDTDFEDAD